MAEVQRVVHLGVSLQLLWLASLCLLYQCIDSTPGTFVVVIVVVAAAAVVHDEDDVVDDNIALLVVVVHGTRPARD